MFYWYRYLKYLIFYGWKNAVHKISTFFSTISTRWNDAKEFCKNLYQAFVNHPVTLLIVKIVKTIYGFFAPILRKISYKESQLQKQYRLQFKKQVEKQGEEIIDFLGGVQNIIHLHSTNRTMTLRVEFDFLINKKQLKEFSTACIEYNKQVVKIILGYDTPKVAKELKKYIKRKNIELKAKWSPKYKNVKK